MNAGLYSLEAPQGQEDDLGVLEMMDVRMVMPPDYEFDVLPDRGARWQPGVVRKELSDDTEPKERQEKEQKPASGD